MTEVHSDHATQPPIPPPTPTPTNPHTHTYPTQEKKTYLRTAANWLNHSMGIYIVPRFDPLHVENEYGTCIVLMSNCIIQLGKKKTPKKTEAIGMDKTMSLYDMPV